MQIHLPTLSLADAERRLVELALTTGGAIVEGARLLGITSHAIKRRIIKYRIEWPRTSICNCPGGGVGGRRLDCPRHGDAVFHETGAVLDDAAPGVVLDAFNLNTADRKMIERALKQGGSIIEAAKLLDTTRHAVKRRILKHGIKWQSVHPAHTHVRMGGGL